MRGCWWFFCLWIAVASQLAHSQSPVAHAFRVPVGFEIDQFATDEQATNIINLTIDSQQRVIVAAPGSLKALVDENKDGRADKSILLANYPKDGAQGLYVDGADLWVVGDGGLWLWLGLVGDKVSIKPAQQILKFPTGAEHGTHSIQLGPDRHWYLIAGNFAAGIQNIGQSTARRSARAGTVWRLDRSFQKRTVWSEGLRNAYDFSFGALSEINTYDSDDERDSGLPFYRPCRIYQLNIDSDAGWVSRGWKDSAAAVTMPQTLEQTGRASPTGVATCLHPAWPDSYYGAILAADWTFGRVWCLKRNTLGTWEKELLVESTGMLGFAPTDLAFTADGSLLISSGGRGTQGAIFALRWKGEVSTISDDPIVRILNAPQPYDGWSRVKWEQEVRKLGGDVIVEWLAERITETRGSSYRERVLLQRAMECLLVDDTPIATSIIQKMLQSGQNDLVRTAWWFLGHRSKSIEKAEVELWKDGLKRGLFQQTKQFDSETVQAMLEALALRSGDLRRYQLEHSLTLSSGQWEQLGLPLQQLLLSVIYRFQDSPIPIAKWEDWPAGNEVLRQLASAIYGTSLKKANTINLELIDRQLALAGQSEELKASLPINLCLLAIQKFLGDWRYSVPLQKDPQDSNVLDGYRALYTQGVPQRLRDSLAAKLLRWIASARVQEDPALSQEVWRTIAMLQPTSSEILDTCFAQFQKSQHPSVKLHLLLVVAQCTAPRTESQTKITAEAMQALVGEVSSQNITTDRNWPSRMQEIVNVLKKRDANLGAALINLPDFGSASDWVWGQALGELSGQAREKMLQKVESWDDKELTLDALRFLQPVSKDSRLQAKLRKVQGRGDLEPWIIEQLATSPSSEDYGRFLAGIGSRDNGLALSAWRGLKRLEVEQPRDELLPLFDLHARLPLPNVPAIEATEIEKRVRVIVKALEVTVPSAPMNRWSTEEIVKNALGEEIASKWRQTKGGIDWSSRLNQVTGLTGDIKRGEGIYRQQRCVVCHQGDSALGPLLTGVSKRFSRDDLFRAIYQPSRDISDRYKSITILTTDGTVVTGIAVYDSVDGVILATATGESVRVKKEEIEQRRPSEQSLMPEGLIDDLNPQQLADLESFLKTL